MWKGTRWARDLILKQDILPTLKDPLDSDSQDIHTAKGKAEVLFKTFFPPPDSYSIRRY